MKDKKIENLVKNFCAVRKLQTKTTTELDKRIINDVITAHKKSKKTTSALTKPNIWRIIMKNKLAKLATAAVIIIAVMIGINQFGSSIDGASVVWADVAKTVGQIDTFTYHTIQTGKNEKTNYESVTYVSKSGRRVDVYQADKIVMTTYFLPAEQAMIILMPAGKRYQRVQLTKKDLSEAIRKADPRELVQQFMSTKHKKLGRKKIDGILVEGIEVADTTLADGDPLKALSGKLWVDVETNLPVLLEAEVLFDNGPQQTIVVDRLQWNIELDENRFVPNIPDDFTQVKPR